MRRGIGREAHFLPSVYMLDGRVYLPQYAIVSHYAICCYCKLSLKDYLYSRFNQVQ